MHSRTSHIQVDQRVGEKDDGTADAEDEDELGGDSDEEKLEMTSRVQELRLNFFQQMQVSHILNIHVHADSYPVRDLVRTGV